MSVLFWQTRAVGCAQPYLGAVKRSTGMYKTTEVRSRGTDVHPAGTCGGLEEEDMTTPVRLRSTDHRRVHMRTHTSRWVPLLLCVLLLAGCGGSPSATGSVHPPTITPTPSLPSAGTISA